MNDPKEIQAKMAKKKMALEAKKTEKKAALTKRLSDLQDKAKRVEAKRAAVEAALKALG